jgi:hypothetical protein
MERLLAKPRLEPPATRRRPAETVSGPENWLDGPRVSVPKPSLVRPAEPPSGARIVASWLVVTWGPARVRTSTPVWLVRV